MVKNYFKKELEKNRIAEVILYQVLESVYDDNAQIVDVAGDAECFHKGDIKVTEKDGSVYFFDAKNDGVIHKTQNVFCETHKYFFKNVKERHSGFMEDGEYNFLSIVDRVSKKIYILDFKILKKIHKNYRKVNTTLADAYCYGNVISLPECSRQGALLYTIEYDGDKDVYWAVDVVNHQKRDVLKFVK